MKLFNYLAVFCLGMMATGKVFGQDTIYITEIGGRTSREKADLVRVITPDSGIFLVQDFYPEGGLQMRGHSSYRDSLLRTGPFTYYSRKGEKIAENYYRNNRIYGEHRLYNEGILKMVENYNGHGDLDGPFLVYHPDGTLKRADVYDNGVLIDKKCYDIHGKDTTWYEYFIFPQFPGGDEKRIRYMMNNLKYPRSARELEIQGTVYVNFIVTEEGEITDIKILKGLSTDIDMEAIRLAKGMPRWIPGKQDGKPVKVSFNMPIRFTLAG